MLLPILSSRSSFSESLLLRKLGMHLLQRIKVEIEHNLAIKFHFLLWRIKLSLWDTFQLFVKEIFTTLFDVFHVSCLRSISCSHLQEVFFRGTPKKMSLKTHIHATKIIFIKIGPSLNEVSYVLLVNIFSMRKEKCVNRLAFRTIFDKLVIQRNRRVSGHRS